MSDKHAHDEALVRREGIRAEELDVHGELFGLKFIDGCSTGCVELYVEDDEWWHHKLTVDRIWLKDLHATVERALRSREQKAAPQVPKVETCPTVAGQATRLKDETPVGAAPDRSAAGGANE